MDIDEFTDDIYKWNIYTIIKYIKLNYVQFMLLFLVVDKPLTRIMPELHEDNDDFIINNKIIPSNTYQIKKRMQKKQTKKNILNEHFGILTN